MTDPQTQILDAARVVFVDTGVVSARMGRIAKEAGISRATLYRYYRTKEDLVRAYAEREMARSMKKFERKLERLPKLSDRLVEAIAFSVETIRKEPAVMPFLEPEALGVTGAIPFESALMLQTMQGAVRALLEGADGSEQLRPEVRFEDLTEWLIRLILSLGIVQGKSRKAKDLRSFVRRLVVPAFVERPGSR